MPTVKNRKKILLITEDRKSVFSRKVIRAARFAKKSLVIEEATFSALTKILNNKIGVVIIDRDEVSGVGDHFFRAIRMFRSHTPVLMPVTKKLLLEQLGTHVYENKITAPQLAKVLVKATMMSRQTDKELPMTYSFEKDIKLERLSELIVKSLQFDKALNKVEKKFSVRFKTIKNLTGEKLKRELRKIQKEAFASPEFKHLRAQIKKQTKQLVEESGRVH